MNQREELIKIAAQLAKRQNMPSEFFDDWDFPKSMSLKSWDKIESAACSANDQCRQWAVMIREIADSL